MPTSASLFASSPLWETTGRLAEDRFGEVWSAVRRSDQLPLAVRVLPGSLSSSKAYLIALIEAARQCTGRRHPDVATPLIYDEAEGRARFVAERPPGKTLSTHLPRTGPLPLPQALGLFAQVLRGLEFVIEHQGPYGRLDPECVWLTNDGRAILLDFGLPYVPPREVALAGGPQAANPSFMAPELLKNPELPSEPSDLFSAGCMLYLMLTGRVPFTGLTTAEVVDAVQRRKPAPIESFVSHQPVARVLDRLLAKLPEERYGCVGEALSDVEALMEGRLPALATGGLAQQTERPSSPAVSSFPRLRTPHRNRRTRAPSGRRAVVILIVWTVGILGAMLTAAAVHVLVRPWLQEHVRRGSSSTQVNETAPVAVETPPSEGTPDAAAASPAPFPSEARAIFEAAEQFAAENPAAFDAQIERYTAVLNALPGTAWALRAQERIDSIRQKQFEAGNEALRKAKQAASELVRREQYGAAIRELEIFASGPQAYGAIRELAQLEILSLRRQADVAFETLRRRAAERREKGDYAGALALYEGALELLGLEDLVERARAEIAILKPLAEASEMARQQEQARRRYEEASALLEPALQAARRWSFAEAARMAASLEPSLRERTLDRQAYALRRNCEILDRLKVRIILFINDATPPLRFEHISAEGQPGELRNAAVSGFDIVAGPVRFPLRWADLSAQQAIALARAATRRDNPADRIAVGVLALLYRMVYVAQIEFEAAQALGMDARPFFEQVAAMTGPVPEALSQKALEASELLLDAETSFRAARWRTALGKLQRLKADFMPTLPGIQLKSADIDSMMNECLRQLDKERVEQDLAAGRSVALLGGSLAGWLPKYGRWTLSEQGILEGYAEKVDAAIVRPFSHPVPFRQRVSVLLYEGRGLRWRLIGTPEHGVDFWLDALDPKHTGLWLVEGGRENLRGAAAWQFQSRVWYTLVAEITQRTITVRVGEESVSMPNPFDATAGPFEYGFSVNYGSVVYFKDFWVQLLARE